MAQEHKLIIVSDSPEMIDLLAKLFENGELLSFAAGTDEAQKMTQNEGHLEVPEQCEVYFDETKTTGFKTHKIQL